MTLPAEKLDFELPTPAVLEIRTAAVDLVVLASYEKLQIAGEPDLIVELIDLYLEDAPRRIAAMRESFTNGNWLAMKGEAHGLRGSSENLGARQMSRICFEIEGRGPGMLFPRIEELLRCLEQELERVHGIFLVERQRRSQ